MGSRKRPDKGGMSQEQLRRYLALMTIPVIVIILILVIVLADGPAKQHETMEVTVPTESQAVDETDSVEADNNEYINNFETYGLQKNEIPEINALMEAYCQAKSSCDAETMYQLYRKTDTSDIEEKRAQMELRSKYIESFQNINCYTTQGLDENSYVVYVNADIKFRVTDTLAPNLMWCYVTKDANGEFYIVENPSQEVLDYVARVEQTEDVRLLVAQVNAKLEEAAASDTRLASAYGVLKAGAPESEETESSENAETAASESETAGNEAESAAQ
ncbi:MAG: hypothetical protein ACLTKI_08210 [Lachnospiraceae bacterium]